MTAGRYRFIVSCFMVAFLPAPNGWSQSVAAAPDGVQVNPPTVNATTFVLLKLKPSQLQLPRLLVEGKGRLSGASEFATSGLEWLKQVSGNSPFLVAADVPYTSAQPVVRIMVANSDPAQLDFVKRQFAKHSAGTPVVNGDFIIASPTHSLENVRYQLDETVLTAKRPGFIQAAKAVSEFPVQILVVPPRYLSDTFDELLPELPDQFGGGPTSVLTKGLRWAAIGVEPNQTTLTVKIQSDSPRAAEAFANRLPELLTSLLEQLPEHYRNAIGPFSKALLRSMTSKVVEDQILVSFGSVDVNQALTEVLAGGIENLTGPISRTGNRKRLRSIGLGIVNYESSTGCFPPSERDRDANGKSNLSWRVHILPYLGEKELYDQFKLDEPWDSPHNLTLLDKMPAVFDAYADRVLADPQVKPGFTPFLAPAGEGTILGGDQVTRIRDVRDGTSKTVTVVEVKPELAVPWTAPRDYRFDAKEPGGGLAWGADDATGVIFCDCAWRVLPKSISDEMLLRLFQMNDGMPVKIE